MHWSLSRDDLDREREGEIASVAQQWLPVLAIAQQALVWLAFSCAPHRPASQTDNWQAVRRDAQPRYEKLLVPACLIDQLLRNLSGEQLSDASSYSLA